MDIYNQPLVTIVDDDPDVRRSLARLLDTIPIQTEMYASASEVLDRYVHNRPGCMVIDMRLPDRDGLDLIKQLRSQGVNTPVLVITAFGNVDSAVRAMKLDALDFLEKPFKDQEFIASVQRAIDLDVSRLDQERSHQAIKQRFDSLSDRERDVLQGIVEGKSSKMIAVDLGLQQKTVDNYRLSLMRKIEAQNVAHLVGMVYKLSNEKK